ncbi:MAG: hypothetical protein ACLR56_12010 [Oscillospiraceae bacterium]
MFACVRPSLCPIIIPTDSVTSPAAYEKALGREYYPQLNIISELSRDYR